MKFGYPLFESSIIAESATGQYLCRPVKTLGNVVGLVGIRTDGNNLASKLSVAL